MPMIEVMLIASTTPTRLTEGVRVDTANPTIYVTTTASVRPLAPPTKHNTSA
jgi:hypothetical protein